MNYTLISLVAVIAILTGCSSANCFDREVTYTDMEKVQEEQCTPNQFAHEILNLKKDIKPYPNERNVESYVATVTFTLLNKESKVYGDVTTQANCSTAIGDIPAENTQQIAAGGRAEITLTCQTKNPKGIYSVSDPIVIASPAGETCKTITVEKPVEKTKIEKVC